MSPASLVVLRISVSLHAGGGKSLEQAPGPGLTLALFPSTQVLASRLMCRACLCPFSTRAGAGKSLEQVHVAGFTCVGQVISC